MISINNNKSILLLFTLLFSLLISPYSKSQNGDFNLKPKLNIGIGFQSPPFIGKKADVEVGMSFNMFLTIPLTYTKKINILYKFIYWMGNSTTTNENFYGWGTSLSLMYALINNPKFRFCSYFGPYALKSLIPLSLSAYNLGLQIDYNPANNFSFGIDINQLMSFLKENVNPYSGKYYPLIITFNFSYQF